VKKSIQDKLKRVRPPRVHITYDVETGGAIEKRELPFVVGVLADLAGQQKEALPQVKERNFVEIDRDNLDKVLARMSPRLAFKVDNRLTSDKGQLGIELHFSSMQDFEPQCVAEQVEPLRKLLEVRRMLTNLRSSLYGNDNLEALLQKIIHDDSALAALCKELGVAGSDDSQPARQQEQ
jgi:type VI secretion system protein ImpB